MADMGAVVGGLADIVGPLLGAALRGFLRTTAGMIVLAVLLASLSFAIAANGSALSGLVAALLATVVCTVAGVVLALKRGVAHALMRGLSRFSLGNRAVALVFDRMLAVSDADAVGDRGRSVARTVERFPLAQAETRLRASVKGLLATTASGSGIRAWFARSIQGGLLARVEAITLARFRDADMHEGGVDLVRVRTELAIRADAMLIEAVQLAVNKLTVLLLLLVSVASLSAAYGLRRLAL